MEHINRIVYTYWTQEGENYTQNFTSFEKMIEIFNLSLLKSKSLVDKVVMYTDLLGKIKLNEAGIDMDCVVVDYSLHKFNPQFWNYPKIITCSMQTERFLHLDMDLILEENPSEDFMRSELVCEKTRMLSQMRYERSFLPKELLNHYTPKLVCSGALGGNVSIFKKLKEVTSLIVKVKGDITDSNRFTLEEVTLTCLATLNSIVPTSIDCKYSHIQGKLKKISLGNSEINFKI